MANARVDLSPEDMTLTWVNFIKRVAFLVFYKYFACLIGPVFRACVNGMHDII